MSDSTVAYDGAEQWLPVVGWEGYYEVSSWGRVRGLRRTVIRKDGISYTVAEQILKPRPSTTTEHQRVNLTRNKVKFTYTVHRLVMAAFVGPCPAGMVVLHWDDVPTNNYLGNLRYGTLTDNRHDSVRNGGHHMSSRTHCKRGHEFTPQNTYHPRSSPNQRQCRRCRPIRAAERAQRLAVAL